MIGLVQTTRLILRQSAQLSQAQRIKIQDYILSTRLGLVEALRDEQYNPEGLCHCGHRLTLREIMIGFTDDPNDFTTTCPDCQLRFNPQLICHRDGSEVQLAFFCPAQTLAQLHDKQAALPEVFLRFYPSLVRSANVHFGGLKQAFAKIGVQYEYEEITGWKKKIEPFLGRLPDTMIARFVDQSATTIRRLRRTLQITPFNSRKALALA